MDRSVTIIAEAGVNHNGSLDRALAMVEEAAKAGADIVKFQTFRAESLATSCAPKAEYQARLTGAAETQFEMLRRLELDEDSHFRLKRASDELGIEFLSTPFDPESLRFLATELNLARIKLGSGEVTNAPLLLAAARSGRPLIVSTGMATLLEVQAALGVLAYGYLGGQSPSPEAFADALRSPEAQKALADHITLLHCTTEYPAPDDEINLCAMDTLRDAFGLPVGLSDHSLGITIPIAAVGRGAVVIEKHFTLDRNLAGPDHAASLEPDELAQLVVAVRRVEKALGDDIKAPTASERRNIPIARKSLVAARAIRAGELFAEENITIKRPGDGISPMKYWQILGQPATQNYEKDDPIQ